MVVQGLARWLKPGSLVAPQTPRSVGTWQEASSRELFHALYLRLSHNDLPFVEGPHHYEGERPGPEGHPENYRLFRKEDTLSWIIFTLVFIFLLVFDNGYLQRGHQKPTLTQAMRYTAFYIGCAACFCLYVYSVRGYTDAFEWATGYILEWMLSVDNLFVFNRIFSSFRTPDDQKHKPLFYGIVGAIVFRMIFFLVEEVLLHNVAGVDIVFGLFLIYTGVRAVTDKDQEEEEDPENSFAYRCMAKTIRYVNRFDSSGRFFVRVRVSEETGEPLPSDIEVETASTVTGKSDGRSKMKWCATRLVLVVVCLEVTDLLFAVDSVSAIVAQIPDLFLAYTACTFAMLGLRAMYFAIDELVQMFSMLAYGVGAILVFLGVKLLLRSYVHVPPEVVCVILLSTLVISIVASVVADAVAKWRHPATTDGVQSA